MNSFQLIRSRSDAVFFLFDLCCWDSLQYAIDQSHKWNAALPTTILHGHHHDDTGSLLFLGLFFAASIKIAQKQSKLCKKDGSEIGLCNNSSDESRHLEFFCTF